MKLHSTRRLHFRLALKQTMWFGVLACLVAWAVYAFMERRIYDRVDEELQDGAIAVRSMLQIREERVTWLNEQADAEVREQFRKLVRYHQILNAEGRVLEASGEFPPLQRSMSPEARAALQSGHVGWETLNTGGDRVRVLDSVVIGPQGRRYLMRIGASLADAEEDSHRLVVLILLLVPVIILVHGTICWVMAGAALRPLQQISAAARQITPDDLDRRIPVSGTGDELEQLSAALNAMISGFQKSFQRVNESVSNLRHELNQPLTVLRAETEQALRGGDLRAEAREVLSKQLEQVELLGRTISELLAVARNDSGGIQLYRESEDLGELVRAAVDGMRMTASEHHVMLSGNVQDKLTAQVDAGQIWRLLLNLIDNAIKFNHANGRVDVMLQEQDGFAVISVIDTGCGIAAGEQANIFERGYRSASARRSGVRGSGLGLYFARSIAEAHGGTIEVSSSPGEGTCVRVFLPQRQSNVIDFRMAAGGRTDSIH